MLALSHHTSLLAHSLCQCAAPAGLATKQALAWSKPWAPFPAGLKRQSSETSQADTNTFNCPTPTQQQQSSCSSHEGQQQQQQQLVSAFAPYAANPPPSPLGVSSDRAGAGASAAATSPTLDKLARLLLGIPQASGQLAEMMCAIQAGCKEAVPPVAGRKRPASSAAEQDEASRAAALTKLAHLLLEVPSLSGSLAKSMAHILETQASEQPPAKRSRLCDSALAGDRCASSPLPQPLLLRARPVLAAAFAGSAAPACRAAATPTPPAAASLPRSSSNKVSLKPAAPRLASALSSPAPASSALAAARSMDVPARVALARSILKAREEQQQQHRRRHAQLVLMRHLQRYQQQQQRVASTRVCCADTVCSLDR